MGLANVFYKGVVPQNDVGSLNRSFSLNWIPYDVASPFNFASCPTKLMDGLASGRPLVSTAIPECMLHAAFIHIVRSPQDAAGAIRELLRNPLPCSEEQVSYAEGHTWENQSNKFLNTLFGRDQT